MKSTKTVKNRKDEKPQTVWVVRDLSNHPECIPSIHVLKDRDQLFEYWNAKYGKKRNAETVMNGPHSYILRLKGVVHGTSDVEDAYEFVAGYTGSWDLMTERDYDGTRKKNSTYLVDVHWDVAKTYEVEAESREEAASVMERKLNAGELSYFDDGYESTDDTSVECVGILGDDDIHHYFS